jgi:hypothetical protein
VEECLEWCLVRPLGCTCLIWGEHGSLVCIQWIRGEGCPYSEGEHNASKFMRLCIGLRFDME